MGEVIANHLGEPRPVVQCFLGLGPFLQGLVDGCLERLDLLLGSQVDLAVVEVQLLLRGEPGGQGDELFVGEFLRIIVAVANDAATVSLLGENNREGLLALVL